MKVNLNNDDFKRKISKFISTGNLSPLSKKADQIDMANVYVYDDSIEVFGTQSSEANNIKAFFTMEAEVEEDGKFMIPNVKALEKLIDFDSELITLSLDTDNATKFGMTSLTIRGEKSEADVSVSTKIGTSIDEDYQSLDLKDIERFKFGGVEYRNVGSIHDWESSVKAIKKNLSYVRTVKVNISSDEESQSYKFEMKNNNSKARYEIDCDGMVNEEIDVTVRSIEPIFQNIGSEVFIYFYEVKRMDNTYKFIFLDNDVYWFFVSSL